MNRRNFLCAATGCAVAVPVVAISQPITQMPPFSGGFTVYSFAPISGDVWAVIEQSRKDFNEVSL
jgi:hypothetical protein